MLSRDALSKYGLDSRGNFSPLLFCEFDCGEDGRMLESRITFSGRPAMRIDLGKGEIAFQDHSAPFIDMPDAYTRLVSIYGDRLRFPEPHFGNEFARLWKDALNFRCLLENQGDFFWTARTGFLMRPNAQAMLVLAWEGGCRGCFVKMKRQEQPFARAALEIRRKRAARSIAGLDGVCNKSAFLEKLFEDYPESEPDTLEFEAAGAGVFRYGQTDGSIEFVPQTKEATNG